MSQDKQSSRNWRSDRPTVEGVYETRCPEHTGDKVFHSRWLNRRWCVDRADADEAAGQWGPSMIQEGREWRGEPMKVGVIRSEPRTRGEGPNGAVCRKCHVLQLPSKKCAYCGADTQPLYFETNPCVVSLFPVNGSNERKD